MREYNLKYPHDKPVPYRRRRTPKQDEHNKRFNGSLEAHLTDIFLKHHDMDVVDELNLTDYEPEY